MNPVHDHLLTTLERRLLDDGVPPDEVDATIADEVRVPRDHYIAYLLVWGALESYRHTHHPDTSTAANCGAADVEVVRWLRGLWEHAGALHEAAVNDTNVAPVVRDSARTLIVGLFDLSDRLLATTPTATAAGAGREVARHA